MAEFQSPRFAGDPLLEQILNDPDTGTLKLQQGSPPDSVRRLQRALFDLRWNFRGALFQFSDTDPDVFIDGTYGSHTTACVLAYKQHYDIHFPPDAPTGSFDGFAGPRTFAKLDPQCVLFDEAIDPVIAKAAELGIDLVAEPSILSPIDNTSGTVSVARDPIGRNTIYYKRGIGAVEVHGRIDEAYSLEIGAPGPTGPLGFPISEERDDSRDFRIQDFENGSIRLNIADGATEIVDLRDPDLEDPIF
jgi:hypothetical protein